ncbi:MAG: DUF3570 domain-containing protein [Deltaproteobacteria bacterium]|nr:DUF3570 domain-containing protein [Deltaproteobacteria bacterium]
MASIAVAFCWPDVGAAEAHLRSGADTLVYADTDNVLVVSPQVSARIGLDEDGGEIGVRATVDVVTAASVDVVSSASTRFSEVRTEIELDASKGFGDHLPGIGYRLSIEPDYVSHGAFGTWQSRLGSSDTTLALSYGLTLDTIGRSGTSFDVWSESLAAHAATVSLTQVLSTRWLVRGTYALGVRDGYMEKPYRHVALFDRAGIERARADGTRLTLETYDAYRLGARPEESIPDSRITQAAGVRVMGWLPALRGSLRVDVQGYRDSWSLMAGAIEPVLALELSSHVELDVQARLYHQGRASFYRRTYVVANEEQIPRYRTADRDLSSYTSGTGGARLVLRFETLEAYAEANVMYTRYHEFLFLDGLLSLVGQVGVRWAP